MVWGMFSSEGVGPFVRIIRTVNANVYLDLEASPNWPASNFHAGQGPLLYCKTCLKIFRTRKCSSKEVGCTKPGPQSN